MRSIIHRLLIPTALLTLAVACTSTADAPTSARVMDLVKPLANSGPSATVSGEGNITASGNYNYTLCASGLNADAVYQYGIYTSEFGAIGHSNEVGNACFTASVSVVYTDNNFTVYGSIYNSLNQFVTSSDTLDVTVNIPPPLSVSISGPTVDTANTYVTMTATASYGTQPYSYAWTINGSPACGNQSTCTGQLGVQGSYTDFAVTVTDADQNTASASREVFAEWSQCSTCLGPSKSGGATIPK